MEVEAGTGAEAGMEAEAEAGVEAGAEADAVDLKNPIGHDAALLGIDHLYQMELHLWRPHVARTFIRCTSWERRGVHPRRLAAPRAHANIPHSRPAPPLLLPLPRKVVLLQATG